MSREVSVVALGMAAVLLLTLVAVVALRAAEQADDRQRIDRAGEDVAPHPPLPGTDGASYVERVPREELAGLDADRVRIEVEGAPTVHADPRHLEPIVVNLLVNADRYGAPPIGLTARTSDAVVELPVAPATPPG